MSSPRVSILIPTLDGEGDLLLLLPALARLRASGGMELRAIDSSSTDRTVELLREAGAEVEVIPRAEFQHGATRNRLAAGARGEFLLFLSQDAVPADEDLLERLVARFDADPRLAGATARVLPSPDDDPLTARTVLGAPEASDESLTLEDASPRAADGPRFNNVAGMVRASALAEVPFPEVEFGEDFGWAARVVARGWRVAFAADAVVHHAHRYGPGAAFRRYRTDAEFLREHHGERVRPSLASAAKGLLYELREDLRYVRAEGAPLRSLLRAPGLRAAQVLGQYVGSRGPRGAELDPDADPGDPGSGGAGAPRAAEVSP